MIESGPAPKTRPRPVDIGALFPELARLARTSVRLHPRPGAPTIRDSSIGGPLAWPSDEPWPVCARDHDTARPLALADVRRRREILDAAWSRPRKPKVNLLTPEEAAVLEEAAAGHAPGGGPNALLPIAQLYARDVPGLPCPEGADLLQVLWCPLGHDDGLPAARLVWRSSEAVGPMLADPPEPADVDPSGSYVPEPCLVHPEPVTEHPAWQELDGDLRERVRAWNDRAYPPAPQGGPDAGRREVSYQFDLSLAPGWKVGGWAPWSFTDAWPMTCETCAAPMNPLLTIASTEWDGASGSWIPAGDGAPAPGGAEPTRVSIGRGYNMQISTCSAAPEHPPRQNMQ